LRVFFVTGRFNKYECTMDQDLWTAGGRCAGQTLHVHSPGGSTFVRELTSWPPS